MDALLEVLFAVLESVLGLLRYGVAVPFCCVACTPLVLIRAFFGPHGYIETILDGYRAVYRGIVPSDGGW